MFFVAKCIELMGDGCLSNEHFEELGGILKGKLEEHFKNQELRQGECPSSEAARGLSASVMLTLCLSVRPSVTDKRRDEDYDEQVEETLQDEVNDPRTHDISTVAPRSATKKGIQGYRTRGTGCVSMTLNIAIKNGYKNNFSQDIYNVLNLHPPLSGVWRDEIWRELWLMHFTPKRNGAFIF